VPNGSFFSFFPNALMAIAHATFSRDPPGERELPFAPNSVFMQGPFPSLPKQENATFAKTKASPLGQY
jgi:hypothetical protein